MSFLSRVKYPSDGSTQIYSIPFPYLKKEHVKVALGGTDTPYFSFLSDTQIKLDVAPAAGTVITVYRDTEKTEKLVNFTDGAALVETALDLIDDQLLYVAQEAYDLASEAGGSGGGTEGPMGEQGPPGHSPVVDMSGDQIRVDGVIVGPHLTGPQGIQGPPGTVTTTGLDFSAGFVNINAATALTGTAFGRLHLCTANSAAYTVTLPSPTSYAGKVLEVIIATSTYGVTLDAGASSTIDGSRTRIMFSGDHAVLFTDGTNWYKVAGRTAPLVTSLKLVAGNTSVSGPATVNLPFKVLGQTNAPSSMYDLANGYINSLRPGKYRANILLSSGTGAPSTASAGFYIIKWDSTLTSNVGATSYLGNIINYSLAAGNYFQGSQSAILSMAPGDYIKGAIYCNISWTNMLSSNAENELSLEELSPW